MSLVFAQDQVSIKVKDQNDQPVLGEAFVVQFHWEIGNFWGPCNYADEESPSGYYFWDIPIDQNDQVDQWRAVCPTTLIPFNPLSYSVTNDIEIESFRWDVLIP